MESDNSITKCLTLLCRSIFTVLVIGIDIGGLIFFGSLCFLLSDNQSQLNPEDKWIFVIMIFYTIGIIISQIFINLLSTLYIQWISHQRWYKFLIISGAYIFVIGIISVILRFIFTSITSNPENRLIQYYAGLNLFYTFGGPISAFTLYLYSTSNASKVDQINRIDNTPANLVHVGEGSPSIRIQMSMSSA